MIRLERVRVAPDASHKGKAPLIRAVTLRLQFVRFFLVRPNFLSALATSRGS